jgi:putative hemolysin
MKLENFETKVKLQSQSGRFLVKTITDPIELHRAFLLRYQVFQVEMIGHENAEGIDYDEFDELADHLAIIDTKTQQLIATCRLNCSLFVNRFYSEQEFECAALLNRAETKLEIGRVCIHSDYRKGVIIMLLWRAIAEYMTKTKTQILFGCGSVMTEDPNEALLLYKYLTEENKIRNEHAIAPTEKYLSKDFGKLIEDRPFKLNSEERSVAEKLLPSLCRSYFDIGCYAAGLPAFDREFKCIDFLTILESDELNPRMRQRMMGN